MLQYNPVVKNGRFKVIGFGYEKVYAAVDGAEALWKWQRWTGLKVYPRDGVEVSEVTPTERKFPVKEISS